MSPGRNDAQQYERDMGRRRSARYRDLKNCAGMLAEWEK
jgi:hypothetical protein